LNQRIPCEFFLFRYVPNVVRGEFVNIGVLIREAQDPSAWSPKSVSTLRTEVRFTRDWRRVRALDPAAETDFLESLEQEIAKLLHADTAGLIPPRSVVDVFSETLSNSIQITEPQATLAESLELELEQLMRLYVEPTLIA